MSNYAKPEAELPFQGIPGAVYMDNGPVSRAKVFQSVMGSLGVRVLTHMSLSEGKQRTPARSKGKVERPFRTLKEAHETLYHFHDPADEAEANLWLQGYLINYNNGRHRSKDHRRIEEWLKHLPSAGVRAMCAWERFCVHHEPSSPVQPGVESANTLSRSAKRQSGAICVHVTPRALELQLWSRNADSRGESISFDVRT